MSVRITNKVVQELKSCGVVVSGYDECSQDCPKERIEQINFVSWIRHKYPDLVCFHPVNESDVPVQKRVLLRQEGLLPGIPDIVILSNIGGHGGYGFAVIEMKRKNHRKSEISKDQIKILKYCSLSGGLAVLSFGCDNAKKIIEPLV